MKKYDYLIVSIYFRNIFIVIIVELIFILLGFYFIFIDNNRYIDSNAYILCQMILSLLLMYKVLKVYLDEKYIEDEK